MSDTTDLSVQDVLVRHCRYLEDPTYRGEVCAALKRPGRWHMVQEHDSDCCLRERWSRTLPAVETTEGALYTESAFQLTERTSNVRQIGTVLPVTEEQLEDVEQVEGYVNNRLVFFLRQRLDQQIVTGDGVAPNLKGILNVSGIQTQAKGVDPGPDALFKAMVKVRLTGRAFPSAFVLHPTDWQNLRLLRTAEGIYLWGSPAEAGPDRIWGLPVAQADSLTQGTAIVGDFANFTALVFRRP